MVKVKKLLLVFTAALVAMSLALSSGVASALSAEEIKGRIENLTIHYAEEANNKSIKNYDGWLNLFSDVFSYAEATEADVQAVGDFNTEHWADWIMRPDGFKAVPDNEENNLKAMLNNFDNNERYWQSDWRVKDDFKLFLDWGVIHYTVQHRDGQEKGYKAYCYDEAKFLQKIRDIYNLDPSTNAQKYDVLCLRALFRAMVEYDKFLGLSHEDSLDGFVGGMRQTGLMEELIFLIANCDKTKHYLETNEDFPLQEGASRQNAVDFYKKLARLLMNVYYNVGDNLIEGQKKLEGTDYNIVFDDSGYVVRIEPIIKPQSSNANDSAAGNSDYNPEDSAEEDSGDDTADGTADENVNENADESTDDDPAGNNPDLITLRPGQGKRAGAVDGVVGGVGGRIIKGTGTGIDHFSAAVVALAISASGVAGLGYVVSRKKRKNVK